MDGNIIDFGENYIAGFSDTFGAKITEAAFDTGFAGSSHIATSSMKLTGMQLRKMLNL